MRILVSFLLFGLAGVAFLLLALVGESWTSPLASPGMFLAYVLLQGRHPDVIVFGVPVLLQFVLYGSIGFFLALPSYLLNRSADAHTAGRPAAVELTES